MDGKATGASRSWWWWWEGAGREPWKFRKRNSVRIWALESDHFKFGQITHWNLSLLTNKVGTQQDPRELAFSSKISG